MWIFIVHTISIFLSMSTVDTYTYICCIYLNRNYTHDKTVFLYLFSLPCEIILALLFFGICLIFKGLWIKHTQCWLMDETEQRSSFCAVIKAPFTQSHLLHALVRVKGLSFPCLTPPMVIISGKHQCTTPQISWGCHEEGWLQCSCRRFSSRHSCENSFPFFLALALQLASGILWEKGHPSLLSNVENVDHDSPANILLLHPTLPQGKAHGPQNCSRIQTAYLSFIFALTFQEGMLSTYCHGLYKFYHRLLIPVMGEVCLYYFQRPPGSSKSLPGHQLFASKKATVKDFEVLRMFEGCQNKKWLPYPFRTPFTLSQVNNSTWKIPEKCN